YQHVASSGGQIASADRAAFYQLKTLMQGVLSRGTANAMAGLAPYAAGKTGTTDGENDAWFVGFTNEVTIAVWVGYDNADGKRQTLGSGQPGASVAVPIWEQIVQAAWTYHSPKTVLNPPSPEAKRMLVTVPGEGVSGGAEYFRRDQNGAPINSRNALVGR